MRVVIAMMKHETNTFSPVPTPIERFAKGQPLQTKQYTAYADRSVWLDWALFDGLPIEQRLSHLCHWVLEFDRTNEEYGLRLPGVVVPPGMGDGHRQKVLRHLALFGVEKASRRVNRSQNTERSRNCFLPGGKPLEPNGQAAPTLWPSPAQTTNRSVRPHWTARAQAAPMGAPRNG